MKRFKPLIFITFGLVSLTLALTLTAFLLGMMPDGHKAELDSRAKVAESLAVQLATAANRNDTFTLESTMESVVKRNPDVFSTAFRGPNGEVIISAGDHAKYWVPSQDGRSTPTHVTVPLLGAKGKQGDIEISFGPPSAGNRYLGIPGSLLAFLAYMIAAGSIGYFFILRRTLKQLDPGRVIPERVQKAFDTLSEGVIILDEKQRILLVNDAFEALYGEKTNGLIGTKINTLSWRMVDGRAAAGGYPWHTALREGKEMREDALSLRTPSGLIHNLKVNATVISGDKDKSKAIGAIVTLADITNENRDKEELTKALEQLKTKEYEVSQQTRELSYMSSHDPLTACLNRKAFFNRFTGDFDNISEGQKGMAVFMVGIDAFRDINQKHGPATGDGVMIELGKILQGLESKKVYVGRYGGAQFCVAYHQADISDAAEFSETIRKAVQAQSDKILPDATPFTVGIGVALMSDDNCSAYELVHRASTTLNAAQSAGASQIQNWDGIALNSTLRNTQSQSLHFDPSEPQMRDVREITASKHMSEDEIIQAAAHAAHDDFLKTITNMIARNQNNAKHVGVVRLSIMSWEYLQEALGDALCELLMRSVKRAIEPMIRDQDDILIMGNTGDMLIALDGTEELDDITWLVTRLLDATKHVFELPENKIYVACRAGIALAPQHGQKAQDLVRNAGMAARRAISENPLEGFLMFKDDMLEMSQNRLQIETGIREALKNDELELSYQPIIDAKSGSLSAAESLLRCNNAKLAKVRMDHVIHVAEQSSLIAEIDMWVIRNALQQMQEWCDAGLQLPKISINISAKQLTNVAFMDKVHEQIKAVRFSPSRVQLEVTETARMADIEVAAPQLKRMQDLGVFIALDDFGTGQASLSYLQRLHPDIIKIDRCFVEGVNTNHSNATMVSAMTVMAHCLGLKVVVEGVETEEQLDFLRETKCDEIQGYLISKPLPSNVMTKWLEVFVRERGVIKHDEQLEAA